MLAFLLFPQQLAEDIGDAMNERSDLGATANEGGIHVQCDPSRYWKGRALTGLQQQSDRRRRKPTLAQLPVAADRSHVVVAIVGIRSAAARRRDEPFGDEVSNLPLRHAGQSRQFAHIHLSFSTYDLSKVWRRTHPSAIDSQLRDQGRAGPIEYRWLAFLILSARHRIFVAIPKRWKNVRSVPSGCKPYWTRLSSAARSGVGDGSEDRCDRAEPGSSCGGSFDWRPRNPGPSAPEDARHGRSCFARFSRLSCRPE